MSDSKFGSGKSTLTCDLGLGVSFPFSDHEYVFDSAIKIYYAVMIHCFVTIAVMDTVDLAIMVCG